MAVLAAALFGFVFLAPATGQAQQIGAGKNIGLGLGWGTFAAGITGKFYMDSTSAIQGHLGSTAEIGHYGHYHNHDHDAHDHHHGEGLGLSIDYVYEPNALATAPAGRLFWGIGGGGAIFGGGGHGGLAINGVAELGWQFSQVPIELVLDYRPFIAFGSGGYADFGFFLPIGFSARVYF